MKLAHLIPPLSVLLITLLPITGTQAEQPLKTNNSHPKVTTTTIRQYNH